LDLAPVYRLAIGDQRQGLHHYPRAALRPLRPEPTEPLGRITAHLQPPATGHLAQLNRSVGILLLQTGQLAPQLLPAARQVLVEEFTHALQAQRLARRLQHRLENPFKRWL